MSEQPLLNTRELGSEANNFCIQRINLFENFRMPFSRLSTFVRKFDRDRICAPLPCSGTRMAEWPSGARANVGYLPSKWWRGNAGQELAVSSVAPRTPVTRVGTVASPAVDRRRGR